MISLRSARGGDTRERYESALILHASRIDRLTDPFGRPVFSSSISCWRIPCRIVYLRYRGGDARLYRERGHGGMIAARFQALRNITSRIPLLRSSFYAGSNAFLHIFYRIYGLCTGAGTRGNKTFDRDRTSFVRPNPNFESEKTLASLIRKFRRARIRNGARSRSAQPGHSLYSAMWKNGYAGGDCARSSVRFFPGLRRLRENERKRRCP